MIDNPWKDKDYNPESEIDPVTHYVYQHFLNLEKPSFTYHNRCSDATMCPRRVWYKRNGYEADDLFPRRNITFMFGDLVEEVWKTIIRDALVGNVYSEVNFGEELGSFDFNGKTYTQYKQMEISFTLPNGERVTGHPDGLGKRMSDGEWELIEIKSSANYGFLSFKGGKEIDYINQVHSLMLCDEMKALGVKSCRFYYMRKETSHIASRLVEFDPLIADKVINNYLDIAKPTPPDRPYELVEETKKFRNKDDGRKWDAIPTGRKVAGFPCNYCPYFQHCFGDYDLDFEKIDQWGNYKPVKTIGVKNV